MAAQFGAARRLGKTYGKATRNQVVHDLFDYRGNQDDTPSTTSSTGSPAATDSRASRGVTRLRELNDSEPLPSLSSPSNSKEPSSSELKRSLLQDTKLFDINSSDDDDSTDTSGSRASKRRRIINLSTVDKPNGQKSSRALPLNSIKPQVNQKDRGRQAEVADEHASVVDKISKELPQPKPSKRTSEIKSTLPQHRPVQRKESRPRPKLRATKSKSPAPIIHQRKDTHVSNPPAINAAEYYSDPSSKSTTQSATTPQREKPLPLHASSNVSSPSQLGLTALKLNTVVLSPAPRSAEASSDESTTHPKSRRRLIDRLDVPSHNVIQISEGHSSDTASVSTHKRQNPSKTRGRLTSSDDKHSQSPKPPLISEGSQNSQSRTNLTTRPRMTYATQRSHLSDMVDDLDNLDVPLSQRSTDELLRQPVTSILGSQLELEEDESDDKSGAVKLKSIHELRQAGANNRFDREIDTLLEDIGTSDRSSKALRLQALMKLIDKLRDAAFLRHLVNNGRVQRLTSLAKDSLDLLTGIFLVSIFSSLAKSEIASIDTLGQLFKGTSDLAKDMLKDDRPLAKIAKDRKQNLSRAMINDLVEFEWFDASSTRCDEVALTCLEYILRRMIQLGDTSAKLSTSVYKQSLRILQAQVENARNNRPDLASIKQMETVLSLLELCSVVADEGILCVRDDEYQALGTALAEILVQANQTHEPLERSVLRVVVSLSNNKPRMCRLLGDTEISKAAFGIIDQNFLNLAKQAEDESSLDGSKLDSVVLALGCLLNFAECDPTLRTRLSKDSSTENNYIAQLVSIFNFQVSKVDEAMTKEQSQVSVAFGYLSMLLCTLSLDRTIQTQVTRLLKNKSFEELCTAAEKFFSHLRTLEHISDDDASMSTFTARFNTILETVRASRT